MMVMGVNPATPWLLKCQTNNSNHNSYLATYVDASCTPMRLVTWHVILCHEKAPKTITRPLVQTTVRLAPITILRAPRSPSVRRRHFSDQGSLSRSGRARPARQPSGTPQGALGGPDVPTAARPPRNQLAGPPHARSVPNCLDKDAVIVIPKTKDKGGQGRLSTSDDLSIRISSLCCWGTVFWTYQHCQLVIGIKAIKGAYLDPTRHMHVDMYLVV